jgi:hypothetical protein
MGDSCRCHRNTGLADEIEAAAAFVVAERDKIARSASAEGEPMFGRMHSRKGTGAPCASNKRRDAGSAFFPKARRGYMASLVIVR